MVYEVAATVFPTVVKLLNASTAMFCTIYGVVLEIRFAYQISNIREPSACNMLAVGAHQVLRKCLYITYSGIMQQRNAHFQVHITNKCGV